MNEYRIGIDMGGTKTEGILMAPSGRIEQRIRHKTPERYRDILQTIKGLVAELEQTQAVRRIGVSAPGTTSKKGLTKNSNTVCVNDKPFHVDLQTTLERTVRIANDADCLALSEATDGAAAGENVVFAAIIGTGLGGGIAVNGRVGTGPNAIRGEWGHTPLPWPAPSEYPGPPCYCGRAGCNEVFLSGTGLEKDYARHSADAGAGAGRIAELANDGDAGAVAALRRYVHRLSRGLAMVVNILDPDVIVLGGGISNLPFLYEQLPNTMQPWIFGGEFSTPIKAAMHGDSSGVRGAAWL